MYKKLGQKVDELISQLSPDFLEAAMHTLLHEGEDVGGGINALRLVKHLLGNPHLGDTQAVWAYDRLKPVFRATFEQIPSLYYFEGD